MAGEAVLLVGSGGREDAIAEAIGEPDGIHFAGMQSRSDIGHRIRRP